MAVKLVTLEKKNGDKFHFETDVSQVIGLSDALAAKQASLTQAQLDAVNSGVTSALVGKIGANETAIGDINTLIPGQATGSNQLADKDFVNSTVQTMSARPLHYDEAGNPFPTKAALDNATTFYYGEEEVEPDEHDFATVLADEEHGNAQTRYTFANGSWGFQYLVNDQPFTAAQNAAINSGITSEKVAQYDDVVAGSGDLLSKDVAAQTYATKAYVDGLGTLFTINEGEPVPEEAGDEDWIIVIKQA